MIIFLLGEKICMLAPNGATRRVVIQAERSVASLEIGKTSILAEQKEVLMSDLVGLVHEKMAVDESSIS